VKNPTSSHDLNFFLLLTAKTTTTQQIIVAVIEESFGECCKLPSTLCGRAPAEINIRAFQP